MQLNETYHLFIRKNSQSKIREEGREMYEYKYVETSLGGFFSEPEHQETINEHAKEGWRLVQVLPTNYNGHGKPTRYEIIFEKQIKNG